MFHILTVQINKSFNQVSTTNIYSFLAFMSSMGVSSLSLWPLWLRPTDTFSQWSFHSLWAASKGDSLQWAMPWPLYPCAAFLNKKK